MMATRGKGPRSRSGTLESMSDHDLGHGIAPECSHANQRNRPYLFLFRMTVISFRDIRREESFILGDIETHPMGTPDKSLPGLSCLSLPPASLSAGAQKDIRSKMIFQYRFRTKQARDMGTGYNSMRSPSAAAQQESGALRRVSQSWQRATMLSSTVSVWAGS